MIYVAIGLALLLILNRLGRRPAKYRDLDTPRLRSLLEVLYVRGLDGGFLHVAVIGSQQFIRVYKHIGGPDQVALLAHVPEVTYSALGLDHVTQAIQAYGLPTFLGARAGIGSAGDLIVDCGTKVSRAVVATEFLLRSVLCLDPERECVAHIERAHPNPRAHPGLATRPTSGHVD